MKRPVIAVCYAAIAAAAFPGSAVIELQSWGWCGTLPIPVLAGW
jgi:hypothetical protein